MQEPNEQNEQEKADWAKWVNRKNLYPAGVCALLLLALLATGMVLYRNLPTGHWRESHTDFPWEDGGVCVTAVKAHWQNSQGNERMELRAAYYPTASVTIKENPTGKGHLIVRFLDDNSTPCGQSIYLPYNESGFIYKEEPNILAMGKEATIHPEAGFRTADDFYNHALAEERQLWKVSVWNHSEGANSDEFMGYITIPATDKAK